VSAVTLLDDENASLWYHPEAKIVHHRIHRFLGTGMFQKLLQAGVECLEQHGATKWLSDDEASVVIAPEDIAWADRVWARRVIASGLKYWAIVNPATAVASLQMRKLVAEYRARGVTVELHETPADALKWLESV
jgi:hypothetical protein